MLSPQLYIYILVILFQATDDDEPQTINSEIEYLIVDGNVNDSFTIESSYIGGICNSI